MFSGGRNGLAQDEVMFWKIPSFRLAVLRWRQRARLTAPGLSWACFKPLWFVSCKPPLGLVPNSSAAARRWAVWARGSSGQPLGCLPVGGTPCAPRLLLHAGGTWGPLSPDPWSREWGTAGQPWLLLPAPGDTVPGSSVKWRVSWGGLSACSAPTRGICFKCSAF